MKLRLALLKGAGIGALLGAVAILTHVPRAPAPTPPQRAAQDQAITHTLNSGLPVTITTPSTVTGASAATGISYATVAMTPSGQAVTFVVNTNANSGGFVSIGAAAPHFAIACDGDTCEARGASLEQMRTLLHRIADKTVTIEMHAIDIHGDCRWLHETIPADNPVTAEAPFAVLAQR
jgi:hypothetical protein